MDRTGTNPTERTPMDSESSNEAAFPQFAELNEDIRRVILSFLADAPYETLAGKTRRSGHTYEQASLTCILPYVNKSFKKFVDDDSNWEAALRRKLADEDNDHIWKSGLRRMLPLACSIDKNTDLLREVRNHTGEQNFSYRQTFQTIFTKHLKFEAPMFLMPCSVSLGEIYGLHLFENRYRRMVSDLMDACANPEGARNGEPIQPGRSPDGLLQPPLLIHFCLPQHLSEGAMAALVQIVWCQTYEHDTADVQLMPIGWVKLNRIWCRRSQDDLFYAKATRM